MSNKDEKLDLLIRNGLWCMTRTQNLTWNKSGVDGAPQVKYRGLTITMNDGREDGYNVFIIVDRDIQDSFVISDEEAPTLLLLADFLKTRTLPGRKPVIYEDKYAAMSAFIS